MSASEEHLLQPQSSRSTGISTTDPEQIEKERKEAFDIMTQYLPEATEGLTSESDIKFLIVQAAAWRTKRGAFQEKSVAKFMNMFRPNPAKFFDEMEKTLRERESKRQKKRNIPRTCHTGLEDNRCDRLLVRVGGPGNETMTLWQTYCEKCYLPFLQYMSWLERAEKDGERSFPRMLDEVVERYLPSKDK